METKVWSLELEQIRCLTIDRGGGGENENKEERERSCSGDKLKLKLATKYLQ